MLDEKFITKKLDKFIALLGINADAEYEFVDGENFLVKVFLKGDNVGYVIGTGGKNIESMQYVLHMMLKNALRSEQKEKEENLEKLRVILDVGDYRAKKLETLIQKVERKVEDARILGEPVDLYPMSPSDRREVHMHLQDVDDVKTESVGEGRERFIRIIPLTEEELGVVTNPEEDDEEAE
jgi:spoIIIJ-associated protein